MQSVPRLMIHGPHAGDSIDKFDGADSLEFLADNKSVAYTLSDAAGRPHQVFFCICSPQDLSRYNKWSWLCAVTTPPLGAMDHLCARK